MIQNIKIKRALLSVSDKRGIAILARTLRQFGCEIISTGGTKKALEAANIPVTDISAVTGNPEAFGGRMKTISFQIESALLFDREKDAREAEALGIQSIDMVVCNLYPFEQVKNQGADFDTLIENIDIGGPTMVRAAAKNFKYVAIVTDPEDYHDIIDELEANEGALSYETRFHLMRKAFNATADYDAMIATTFDETAGELSLRLAFDRAKPLRYGENSHQTAFFLRHRHAEYSIHDLDFLHGKELSYNNIVDLHSALEAVRDLSGQGCAIIKHNNPCGLAQGSDQRHVFEAAWAGDPVSAFGSVIAFNQPLGKNTATFLHLDAEDKSQRKFVEVIVAPDFTPQALEYLKLHKNLRVVRFDPNLLRPDYEMKALFNGLLFQTTDNKLLENTEVVTRQSLPVSEELLHFGLIAVRQIKSNAIVIVRALNDGTLQLLGMGAGQPNRINSTRLAIERAEENLKMEYSGAPDGLSAYIEREMGRALLVSDAFFPFPDNVELAHAHGIRAVVQPGGSIRDKSVIQKCDELGMAMMFTGVRHFRH